MSFEQLAFLHRGPNRVHELAASSHDGVEHGEWHRRPWAQRYAWCPWQHGQPASRDRVHTARFAASLPTCRCYGADRSPSGVMRFLQTEWHRHERDRNAWEIEKQEMKGRIASLEGSARRSDATQKALKKYVAILEKKVKEQAAQLRAAATGAGSAPDSDAAESGSKFDRSAKIQEKLRGKFMVSGTSLDTDTVC